MKTKPKRKAPPHNRRATGRFRKGNPIGKATRFPPGVSGNPGGRPKLKVVSEAARALLASTVPGDKYGRTFAEAIVLALGLQAVEGNISAASELTDRAEGRARQAMDIQQTDPLLDLICELKAQSKLCGPVEGDERE